MLLNDRQCGKHFKETYGCICFMSDFEVTALFIVRSLSLYCTGKISFSSRLYGLMIYNTEKMLCPSITKFIAIFDDRLSLTLAKSYVFDIMMKDYSQTTSLAQSKR